jgi:hypothetical protein
VPEKHSPQKDKRNMSDYQMSMSRLAAFPETARQAFEEAVNVPDPPRRNFEYYMSRCLHSSYGVAGIGFVIVVLALYFINPPMVQSKTVSDIEHRKRDATKILGWGAGSAVAILLVPQILKLAKTFQK